MNEDTNNGNIEPTNDEVEVTPEVTEETEAEVTLETEPEVDVARLQEINKKLFARAKKAEEALKAKPKQVVQPKTNTNINNASESYLTREEAILIAKGEDETSLTKLKAIAKGSGVSLLDAQKDEMFIAWKERQEKESKTNKAKLGASKGSGSQKPEKTVSEMTSEEHKAYVLSKFAGR